MLVKIKSFLFENTSDKQTIIKNTFWLMLAEFLSKGSMFLITILIARILGPTEFGMLSFIMSFVAMFVVITDFGLTTLMVREVSRDHSLLPSYLVNLSFLKIILGIITFFLVLLAASFLGKEPIYFQLILIYAAYSILNNIGEFLRAFFRPSESMQYEALLKSINGALMLLIVWGALFWKEDLESIMYGYLFVSILNFLITFIYLGLKNKKVKVIYLDKTILRKLFFQAIPFGLKVMFWIVYFRIDIVMLGFLGSDYEVWIYWAWYKILDIYLLFISLFFSAFYPNIVKNKNKVLNNFFRYIIILSIFMLIFLLVNSFLSNYIVSILFWSLYLDLNEYINIMFIAILFIAVNYFLNSIIEIFNKQWFSLLNMILASILNIVLNIILYHYYQLYWLVYATILSEIFIWILLFIEIKFKLLWKKQ